MKKNNFKYQNDFKLESGKHLPGFELTYHTAGSINSDQSNIIWVCHALTANSDVSDWWKGLYGKNRALDPEKYFIICANVLGSCYGSSQPLSVNPETCRPYYHKFPEITIRDIVNAFDLLRLSLGINQIHTLIGGSLGGQQVLEWAAKNSDLFSKIIPIATNAQHSSWGIAYNETQRLAIQLDPTWPTNSADAGIEGMKTARAVALLSYRSYQTYEETQKEETNEIRGDYQASSYQRYQGNKLASRFNAYSYWHLSKAMDSHNIGRGRIDSKSVLLSISIDTLVIGINSDNLFPTKEQVFLFNHLPNAKLDLIDSKYGHDGFLTETAKLNPILIEFINKKARKQLKTTLAFSI